GGPHRNPERFPVEAAAYHWSDNKLAGGPSCHAEHLGRTDQRGCLRGGKVFGGNVNCSHQSKDTTAPLKEPAGHAQATVPASEQQRSNAYGRGSRRQESPWPNPIHCRPGHKTERGVAVVEHAEHRCHPERAEPEGIRELRHHHGWS